MANTCLDVNKCAVHQDEVDQERNDGGWFIELHQFSDVRNLSSDVVSMHHVDLQIFEILQQRPKFLQLCVSIQLILQILKKLIVIAYIFGFFRLKEIQLMLVSLQTHLDRLDAVFQFEGGVILILLIDEALHAVQQWHCLLADFGFQLFVDQQHVNFNLFALFNTFIPVGPINHLQNDLKEIDVKFVDEAVVNVVDVRLEQRDNDFEEPLDDNNHVWINLVELLVFVTCRLRMHVFEELADVFEECGFGQFNLVFIAGNLGYLINEVEYFLGKILDGDAIDSK